MALFFFGITQWRLQALRAAENSYALGNVEQDKPGCTAFLGSFSRLNRPFEMQKRIALPSWDLPKGPLPGKQNYQAWIFCALKIKQGRVGSIGIDSDDGHILSINGKVVSKDWKRRPSGPRRLSVELSQGLHLVALRYFQAKGEAMLLVNFKGAARISCHQLGKGFELDTWLDLHKKTQSFEPWAQWAWRLFIFFIMLPGLVWLGCRTRPYWSGRMVHSGFQELERPGFAPWKGDNLVIWLGFALLALFFTYPLVHNMAGSFPSDFGWKEPLSVDRHSDSFQFIWNLWWFKQAMLEGQNPFYCPLIYHPFGASLAYHTTTPAFTLPGALFHLVLDLIPAYNLTFMLTLIFSGYNAYFLLRYLGLRLWPAFVGGCVYAFNPYHMGKGLSILNQFSYLWVPLFLYFLFRACLESKQTRLWLGLGLISALNFYAGNYSLVYCMFFLIPFVLLGPKLLGIPRLERDTLKGSVLAGAVMILAVLPLAGQMLWLKFFGPGVVELWTPPSMPWEMLFTKPMLHPFSSHEDLQEAARNMSFYWYNYLGAPLAAMSLLGLVNPKRLRPAIWFACAGLFFCLVSVNPGNLVTHVLERLPLLGDMRMLDSFLGMALLCCAVLTGFFFDFLLTQRPAGRFAASCRVLACLAAGLLLFEFWSLPYPTYAPKTPKAIAQIMRDPRPGAVLELPLEVKKPWVGPNRFMYYQTLHDRPRFVHTLSRMPKSLIDPYRKFKQLHNLNVGDPLDPARLARELNRLEVRYIMVEKKWYRAAPWLRKQVAQKLPWELVGRDAYFELYRRPLDSHRPSGHLEPKAWN